MNAALQRPRSRLEFHSHCSMGSMAQKWDMQNSGSSSESSKQGTDTERIVLKTILEAFRYYKEFIHGTMQKLRPFSFLSLPLVLLWVRHWKSTSFRKQHLRYGTFILKLFWVTNINWRSFHLMQQITFFCKEFPNSTLQYCGDWISFWKGKVWILFVRTYTIFAHGWTRPSSPNVIPLKRAYATVRICCQWTSSLKTGAKMRSTPPDDSASTRFQFTVEQNLPSVNLRSFALHKIKDKFSSWIF